MNWIKPTTIEIIKRRVHEFEFVNDKGAGYSFDLDQNNNLVNSKPQAIQNYKDCLTGIIKGEKVRDLGVRNYDREYKSPPILECDCGMHVEIDGDSSCDRCGAWYNGYGQKLNHPSQWGEETGETFSDNGQYLGGGYD